MSYYIYYRGLGLKIHTNREFLYTSASCTWNVPKSLPSRHATSLFHPWRTRVCEAPFYPSSYRSSRHLRLGTQEGRSHLALTGKRQDSGATVSLLSQSFSLHLGRLDSNRAILLFLYDYNRERVQQSDRGDGMDHPLIHERYADARLMLCEGLTGVPGTVSSWKKDPLAQMLAPLKSFSLLFCFIFAATQKEKREAN